MSVTTIAKKDGPPAEATAPKSKKKLIIIVVAVLVLALGGGGFFFMSSKKNGGAAKAPKDVAGVVVPLEPIQVNLSGEHYLRIGISLQMTTTAGAESDGGKALDATIAVFSGKPVSEVNDAKGRARLKAELLKEVRELYEKTVMDVYFTQFVTQ